MSSNIMNTSEVNPFDFYVQNKIDLKVLLYKILCGAVVTLIALRLNEALKIVADKAAESVQEYTRSESLAMKASSEIAVTVGMAVIFAFAARLSMGERDMQQVFNVMSDRE